MLVNSKLIEDVGVLEPTFFAYPRKLTGACVPQKRVGFPVLYLARKSGLKSVHPEVVR